MPVRPSVSSFSEVRGGAKTDDGWEVFANTGTGSSAFLMGGVLLQIDTGRSTPEDDDDVDTMPEMRRRRKK